MKIILFLSVVLMLSHSVDAQKKFPINHAEYRAEVIVDKCPDNMCSGAGIVKLYKKSSTTTLFQQLNSDDLIFSLEENSYASKITENDSPLIFDDFNFDGRTDLAVRNGSNSGYGGPSYDVYVYNSTRKQFVPSAELTKLATTNSGMFEVDKKMKRLKTFTKSGCCWHSYIEYEVKPGKGIVKVQEIIEDATKGDEKVRVTTKKLVNKKWTSSSKTFKVDEYYK